MSEAMESTPIVVLMTDFGLKDAFVGVMKGVIASICRHAAVIDLTHEIGPQDVREAAFTLDRSVDYFPEGSIFTCIVDPGVGTARRPLAVEAGPWRFIAPDNGLLTAILDRHPAARCHAITSAKHRLPSCSATFHGRDIFSPAAAHLAAGLPIGELGPEVPVESCERIRLFSNLPIDGGAGWQGEVLSIDHFGNLITSLEGSLVDGPEGWTAQAGDATAIPFVRTYGEVAEGMPLAYAGSSGMVEIAIRNGSARDRFELEPGSTVRLIRKSR